MCGICGVIKWRFAGSPDLAVLRKMAWQIRHRGPDDVGLYLDEHAGLGHTRLAIIDLKGGAQPMTNEDGSLWITYNGEVYNYIELTHELEAKGHCFHSRCDTEVILHLYEEYGTDCLQYLNGQFAFAIWDRRQRCLFAGRDRLGVRPFYYTVVDDAFVFGSEIKCLQAYPGVDLEIDPQGLDQVFTFWSALPPNTIFKEVFQLPPASYLLASDHDIRVASYWQLPFHAERESELSEVEWAGMLQEALIKAVRLRMRADVPIGAYLSGGLDSSLTSAFVKEFSPADLETFSIRFEEAAYDEGTYQEAMITKLRTRHHSVLVRKADIASAFPEVIRHVETPLLRTAPVPLHLLSRLVRESGIKVVVTGEGADEFFAGYNIFKENKIRRLWANDPESPVVPQLLMEIYPYIRPGEQIRGAFWQQFFAKDLLNTDDPCYSHHVRWNNTAFLKRFLTDDIRARGQAADCIPCYRSGLPKDFGTWDSLSQAQYIEITTLLSGYLLCSQGDRVAMSHGVEGRFPFLDHELIELACRIPAALRLKGMDEKHILKTVAKGFVPETILKRPKQPYRAPDSASFLMPDTVNITKEWLSGNALRNAGIFEPRPVEMLVDKLAAHEGSQASAREDMAVIGILSTQLVFEQFVHMRAEEPASNFAVRIVKAPVVVS